MLLSMMSWRICYTCAHRTCTHTDNLGAISSEDIPMNLSREMLQNSHVLTKLSDIMTSKVIKWLQEEARKDATKFESFFNEFGTFLREGVCMAEPKHQRELAKLLRYESSALDAGKMTSLDDYLERKKAEQKDIYYLISSSRKWAEESPYFEQFKAKGVEVLFLYDPVDEFVVERLEEFKGIKLKSIDASGNDELLKSVEDKSVDGAPPKASFTDDERAKLVGWFKDTLGKSVSEVKVQGWHW